MKIEHKTGLIGIIYACVGALVVFIVTKRWDETTSWFVLGSAVSLFNYGQLLVSSKPPLQTKKVISNIILRWVMIVIVLFFAAYRTQYDMLTLILVLLGLISSKVGLLLSRIIFRKAEETTHD